jgi:predicted dehydrogenase
MWNGGCAVLQAIPQAKKYHDFRKMLEEMDKQIDAITVATPDNTRGHLQRGPFAWVRALREAAHARCL